MTETTEKKMRRMRFWCCAGHDGKLTARTNKKLLREAIAANRENFLGKTLYHFEVQYENPADLAEKMMNQDLNNIKFETLSEYLSK